MSSLIKSLHICGDDFPFWLVLDLCPLPLQFPLIFRWIFPLGCTKWWPLWSLLIIIGVRLSPLSSVIADAFIVDTGVDLVRLSESLAAMEPGTNVEREKVFVTKISPAFSGLVDKPTIILGEGGTVALWYLTGALAQPMQVGS